MIIIYIYDEQCIYNRYYNSILLIFINIIYFTCASYTLFHKILNIRFFFLAVPYDIYETMLALFCEN